MSDDEEIEKSRKLEKASITLEHDLIEWGKEVPGGLSLLCRILLRQVKDGTIDVVIPVPRPTRPKRDTTPN